MIETVDSIKLADLLEKKWESMSMPEPLKVLVQVNTSQEEGKILTIFFLFSIEFFFSLHIIIFNSFCTIILKLEKSGVSYDEVINLYRHIRENCKNLNLEGLMTIGKFGHDYTLGPNPDFINLMNCHKTICNEFAFNEDDIHVSMGMSDDFEQAVSLNLSLVFSFFIFCF